MLTLRFNPHGLHFAELFAAEPFIQALPCDMPGEEFDGDAWDESLMDQPFDMGN